MAIERLSLIDSVTASTYFAVNVNNQDYRAAAGTVANYVNSLVEQNPAVVSDTIQYASPSSSFTFTLTNNGVSTWLVLTPVGIISTGTIVLPQVSNASEGQEILVITTQPVGSLSINANGASVIGAPSSLSANECFKLKFEPISKIWYRVQIDSDSVVNTDTIQYLSPSTSFSLTLTQSGANTWLALTPTGVISSGTIVLPDPNLATSGQEILFTTTQNISSLTIDANGGSVVGAPTVFYSGQPFKLKFEPVAKIWYLAETSIFNFGTY